MPFGGSLMERLGLMFGIGRYAQTQPQSPRAREQSDRTYTFNQALYDGSAYLPAAAGGFRELILQKYFNLKCTEATRFTTLWNPFRPIVDSYQNVFRGTFGGEIKVEEKFEENPVSPNLIDAVGQIWATSRFDTRKQVMQEWAANLGTVGLRIVATNNADAAQRRVSVQVEHPDHIYDFDENDRGDVVAVELRYQQLGGAFGEDRDIVEVREVITKDKFVKEFDGRNILEPDQQVNALGVCPYVILRHRDQDKPFGAHAYQGAESIVFALNWLASNQADSVFESVWPVWFASAGGEDPKKFKAGRGTFWYVKTDPDTPNPSLEALVPQLNQAGALAFTQFFLGQLRQGWPELVLGNIEALSGQSGETIAQLLVGTKSKIEQAKANYEHAVIRAYQIAMSYGVMFGMWNLGAGNGTADAANKSFADGLENFAFNDRPALPPTVMEKIQQAQADGADQLQKFTNAKAAQGIVNQDEQLRIAGYTDADLAKVKPAPQPTNQPSNKLAQLAAQMKQQQQQGAA